MTYLSIDRRFYEPSECCRICNHYISSSKKKIVAHSNLHPVHQLCLKTLCKDHNKIEIECPDPKCKKPINASLFLSKSFKRNKTSLPPTPIKQEIKSESKPEKKLIDCNPAFNTSPPLEETRVENRRNSVVIIDDHAAIEAMQKTFKSISQTIVVTTSGIASGILGSHFGILGSLGGAALGTFIGRGLSSSLNSPIAQLAAQSTQFIARTARLSSASIAAIHTICISLLFLSYGSKIVSGFTNPLELAERLIIHGGHDHALIGAVAGGVFSTLLLEQNFDLAIERMQYPPTFLARTLLGGLMGASILEWISTQDSLQPF